MNRSEWQQQLLNDGAQFNTSDDSVIDAFNQTAITSTYITPLLYQSVLSISGPDSNKFLQGQLTCDVNRCTSDESILGAACSPQGRMYSSFRMITNATAQEPGYLLRMRSNLVTLTHETLHKYSVFFKTQLQDASDEWLGIGLWGEQAQSLLEDSLHIENVPQQVGQIANNDTLVVIRLPGEQPRFECWVKAEAITDIWQALSAEASPAGNHPWFVDDIRSGIAEVSQATESAFNPHMLNFQAIDAVSFNKGCYTGQEIVARTHYKGKSKRHTQRFTVNDDELLMPGDELQLTGSDKTVATVISSAFVDEIKNCQETLLVVNADLETNGALELQHNERQFFAKQGSLPYSLDEEK